jgi:Fur family peroxide stress response transcriptional regulator
LAEDLNHPTADSVYKKLEDRVPGMSHATVYRALEFLEHEKIIRRVSAPAAVARFDANLDFHQHLSCRICGNLVDISLPELAKPTLPSVSDFTVEELDIRLVGRCRRCESSGLKRRGRRPASHNQKS